MLEGEKDKITQPAALRQRSLKPVLTPKVHETKASATRGIPQLGAHTQPPRSPPPKGSAFPPKAILASGTAATASAKTLALKSTAAPFKKSRVLLNKGGQKLQQVHSSAALGEAARASGQGSFKAPRKLKQVAAETSAAKNPAQTADARTPKAADPTFSRNTLSSQQPNPHNQINVTLNNIVNMQAGHPDANHPATLHPHVDVPDMRNERVFRASF